MPLLVPFDGEGASWSLSNLSICKLTLKSVFARAKLRSRSLWSLCSNERMSRVRSNCFALIRPTCFSNCRTRQVSRSVPEVSNSTVELIDLRVLSIWFSLLRKSREGSAAVSRPIGGALMINDDLLWLSCVRRSIISFILSSWSSNMACSLFRVSTSSSTSLMMWKWCVLKLESREINFSVWTWNLTELLDVISGLSSSLQSCVSKQIIIPRTGPLNFLAWDSFPALSDIVLIV